MDETGQPHNNQSEQTPPREVSPPRNRERERTSGARDFLRGESEEERTPRARRDRGGERIPRARGDRGRERTSRARDFSNGESEGERTPRATDFLREANGKERTSREASPPHDFERDLAWNRLNYSEIDVYKRIRSLSPESMKDLISAIDEHIDKLSQDDSDNSEENKEKVVSVDTSGSFKGNERSTSHVDPPTGSSSNVTEHPTASWWRQWGGSHDDETRSRVTAERQRERVTMDAEIEENRSRVTAERRAEQRRIDEERTSQRVLPEINTSNNQENWGIETLNALGLTQSEG